MKNLIRITSLFLMMFCLQNVEAQFLKKLKDKVNEKINQVEQQVENKIENKIDEKVDKTVDETVDGVFDIGKKKKTSKQEDDVKNQEQTLNENKTYGSTIIKHNNDFGSVNIEEISQIKVERSNDGYTFYGSWRSHEVDIFDGFRLDINSKENLRNDENNTITKNTFKIPEEASLKLAYDPQLPYYEESSDDFKRGVSDDYQNYDVNSGSVTLDVLDANNIQISFSGNVTLKKIERNSQSTDDYTESFYSANITGAFDGEAPQFINNSSITNNNASSSNSGSTNSDVMDSYASVEEAKGIYKFTYETVVEITAPDQDRKYKMSYLLNPNAKYMAMKADVSEYSEGEMDGESLIVLDGDQTFVFVNTSGMKIQMSSAQMGNQQASNPTDQMENYDYNQLQKTGRTKTILGASCYEYVMNDNQNSIQMWVAPEVNIPNWFMMNTEYIEGYIMEYTIDSPEGKATSTTIEINDNISKIIKVSEYKKMF